MPEYRIRETGEIVTNLATHFPSVSLPAALSVEDFDVLGVDPVLEGPQPTLARFQSAYRDGVEQIEGQWFTKWGVDDWAEEAVQIAVSQQWDGVRSERNELLAASDWTQLADCPLDDAAKAAWAVYRQALRDVTAQGDPFEIAWPEKP